MEPEPAPLHTPPHRPLFPWRRLGWMTGICATAWIAVRVIQPLLIASLPHTSATVTAASPAAALTALSPPPVTATPPPAAAPPIEEPKPVELLSKDALPPPAMQEELQTVEHKLDQLNAAEAQNDATAGALHALDEELKTQAAQIAQLKSRQQQALHAVMLFDAYDRLKEAAFSGKPFAEELAPLQAESALQPAWALLMPFAASGIPTLPQLQASFAASAAAALHPPLNPQAGFMASLRANLARLITIRRVGTPEGMEVDAVIARAETVLSAGDVAAAVEEISHLNAYPARHLPLGACRPTPTWLAAVRFLY